MQRMLFNYDENAFVLIYDTDKRVIMDAKLMSLLIFSSRISSFNISRNNKE